MLADEDDPAGPVVLVCSGEVYNFQELHTELVGLGCVFRTRSDTEVVLQAYRQWGAACVERLNGIFAFAVWDSAHQSLLLVRDRRDDAEQDRYRTLLARVPRLPGEDAHNARMREVRFLSMQRPLQYLLDRKDRMSMAHAVEVIVTQEPQSFISEILMRPTQKPCGGANPPRPPSI